MGLPRRLAPLGEAAHRVKLELDPDPARSLLALAH